MTWLLQLFRRRPDVGLQLEAHRFGRTVTEPGRYDYAKAVAGKRKAEQRLVDFVEFKKPAIKRESDIAWMSDRWME